MNIEKLIDIIWKNPTIEDDYLISSIQELPDNQLAFLSSLSRHLNKGSLNVWLNDGAKLLSHEDSENKINEIKKIIICFYLSEYRLDDLLYWPQKLRDNQLKKIVKAKGLNKEKLLSIYFNWPAIKEAMNKLLYDTTTEQDGAADA